MEGGDPVRNLMPYLRQADATFRNGFETDEMKEIFLRNTFEEIDGEESSLCTKKSPGFIIEGMLKESSLDVIRGFYSKIQATWSEIAKNQGGCHIIETLSRRVVQLLNAKTIENDQIQKCSCLAELVEMDNDVLLSMMSDVYASHALRGFLQLLGGMSFAKENEDKDIVLKKARVPKGFIKTLKSLCKHICQIESKRILGLLGDAYASPTVAVLFRVLNKRHLPKTSANVCHRILKCCRFDTDDKSTFFILAKDRYASHVFEAMVEYGPAEVSQVVRAAICSDKDRFFELCSHPVANFVIQRLISCADEQQFSGIFDTLSEGLEDILADQNYGILQKTAEQCVKHPSFQGTFYDRLLTSFHCETAETKKHFVTLVATLTTFESFFKGHGEDRDMEPAPKLTVEYHGSVLLQILLQFENVGLIVKGLCEMPKEHIVSLVCDASGSHFIDAFFVSSKVKLKKKRDLLQRVETSMHEMACNKYGSHVLENIWDRSDIAVKKLIAESLSPKLENLSHDQIGRFLARKFGLKQFRIKQPAWERFQKQNSNKRKLFADLVEQPAKSKRKSIKNEH